ncbi:TetR/AcrR family transcriptional regulator [Arenibacterium sp. LLYu02]|uniref:TetR/AcrR family transcriptional regulator n=1 Tax=Arenibacterium sp. LLYu02 TaxID=3404132 RepID=UPI003B20B9E3
MSENKRSALVAQALPLFYRNGFHATGMDLVAKETGVSKTSIYKHFRSKEELILAVLRLRDEQFRNWLYRRMEALGSGAEAQLLAMFDALGEWFRETGFQGCMFVKAAAEYQQRTDAINRQSWQHKELLIDHLSALARTAGFADPMAVARQVLLLKEGAIILAAMSHSDAPAQEAKAMAEALLKGAQRS